MALLSTWTQEIATSGRSMRAFTDMTMAPTPVDMVTMSIVRTIEDRLRAIRPAHWTANLQ